jgi:sensor histidine kinase YesM
MVLLTFVENAFKYGISNHEPASITIALLIDENHIIFTCRNKLFEVPRNVVSTGVGLANVRQRLAHLYPNRHSLDINQEGGFFTVQLSLMA